MKQLLQFLFPKWEKMNIKEWSFLIVQVMMVAVLSMGEAVKGKGQMEPVLIFVLAFMMYMWLIKVLANILEWLQEYLKYVTANMVFIVVVPIFILLCFSYINTRFERQVSFMALILSVVMAYFEMLAFITESQSGNHQLKKMSKALKVKSIMTWLFIILLNLYTVLVVVQFNGNPYMQHFIHDTIYNKSAAIDLFYYLIVTFSTVGFGDIYPQTQLAKLITGFIALSGMLFSGMFVATILSKDEKSK